MPTCPSCGKQVPPGFAFCGQCGAPMGASTGYTSANDNLLNRSVMVLGGVNIGLGEVIGVVSVVVLGLAVLCLVIWWPRAVPDVVDSPENHAPETPQLVIAEPDTAPPEEPADAVAREPRNFTIPQDYGPQQAGSTRPEAAEDTGMPVGVPQPPPPPEWKYLSELGGSGGWQSGRPVSFPGSPSHPADIYGNSYRAYSSREGTRVWDLNQLREGAAGLPRSLEAVFGVETTSAPEVQYEVIILADAQVVKKLKVSLAQPVEVDLPLGGATRLEIRYTRLSDYQHGGRPVIIEPKIHF